MTRWSDDPEAAADALIERCLRGLDLGGRILMVNQGGALPTLLAARGMQSAVWNRRLIHGLPAAPWPPAGPFDLALVRLPKARQEQEMTLHAAASVLRPGARLILYGGNDEGIRPAAAMLQALAPPMETIAARGHGRVVAAAMPERIEALRGSLAAWRTVSRLVVAGIARDWVTYPGTFAAGRIDEGTALLSGALPALGPRARVLDYGCGTGLITAAVLAHTPDAAVDALDNDVVALEAVRENAPSARRIAGVNLADAGRQAYDAILSNPPLHDGIAEDHAQLQQLIAAAPDALGAGGVLQLVVQRRVALDRLLQERFAKPAVVAETGRYRVWRAVRA